MGVIPGRKVTWKCFPGVTSTQKADLQCGDFFFLTSCGMWVPHWQQPFLFHRFKCLGINPEVEKNTEALNYRRKTGSTECVCVCVCVLSSYMVAHQPSASTGPYFWGDSAAAFSKHKRKGPSTANTTASRVNLASEWALFLSLHGC